MGHFYYALKAFEAL